MYGRKAAESFKWNEHLLFLAARVVIGLVLLLSYHLSIFDRIVIVITWILCYPLIHDESYYYTQAKIFLSRYVYGYQSSTSTAHWEFNKFERLWMAIAGLAVLCGCLIVKYWR